MPRFDNEDGQFEQQGKMRLKTEDMKANRRKATIKSTDNNLDHATVPFQTIKNLTNKLLVSRIMKFFLMKI